MKSISKQSWLIAITMLSLPVMAAVAAPLPSGTVLNITQGVGSGPNLPCASGSCFGMEVAPGFVIWTDFGAGTDAGFVVGKAQACGSQEIGPSPSNTTPSQLTTAWYFFNNYGTFCTDPDGGQNIFNDASCTGAGCVGKTELKYLYAAWNGNKISLGSSVGCVDPNCSADQKAGVFVADYQINLGATGPWSMEYRQVVPSGPFLGVKFQVKYRGEYRCEGSPPYAEVGNINLIAPTGATVMWVPIVRTFVSCGSYLATCRILTPPANGTATIASDCSSGNYQSERGFIGIDSFTYVADISSPFSSLPGTVTVAVVDTSPTPTYTALPTASLTTSPTYSPTFTSTASPTPTVTPPVECRDAHPVIQVSSLGKQGTLSVSFTGNIVSATNKEIKICPGTTLSYSASSTQDVVKCKVKNSLTSGNGTLRIRDHLKCTDKPGGKDKVQFKVKSGVTK